MRKICLILLLSVTLPTLVATSPPPAEGGTANPPAPTEAPRKIGIEGKAELDLPRSDYRSRPLDDRTELILRIGSVTASTNGLWRYDLYFMGFEPGDYPLANYLVLPDGSQPAELAGIQLHVRATLPEDHDGQLTRYVPGTFPFIGGYRMFLGLLGLLWVAGITAFIWSYRKRPVVMTPVTDLPEPSFAERLQPLVEAAANGRLSTEGKAQIERLLMGYWREKLGLPESRMAEALARLKAHAQAGALLRALERWLHQRAGASKEEVNRLLEPYRAIPTPVQSGGGPS